GGTYRVGSVHLPLGTPVHLSQHQLPEDLQVPHNHVIRDVARDIDNRYVELQVADKPFEHGLPGLGMHHRPLAFRAHPVGQAALTPPLDITMMTDSNGPILQITRHHRDVAIHCHPGGVRTLLKDGYSAVHYDVVL